MVSVMRAPVCSSLDTTSPPRRLRSSTSESPVDLSVELTSSPEVAIDSASRLEVSTSVSVICCERSSMSWTTAVDFCAKPCVTSSRRPSIICARLVVSSANSSVMWSVLKFRLEVSRSLALAMALAVSPEARSSRSSRSPPRSPSALIMVSPARPSAMVMCSPFSVSAAAIFCALSLTRSATWSLTDEMSCDRSRCTPVMALRTCSAWPTRVSR